MYLHSSGNIYSSRCKYSLAVGLLAHGLMLSISSNGELSLPWSLRPQVHALVFVHLLRYFARCEKTNLFGHMAGHLLIENMCFYICIYARLLYVYE
jgi:hypothetical protein